MSAAGEERSSKRGNTENRQAGQQRPNAAPKENIQSRKGGKNSATVQSVNNKTPESPSTPNLPPLDEHVPLNGFNAAEVDNLLKKGFDPKAHVYRSDSQPHKAGNVWSTKVGAMASGKDFWLELRKQVTALQQTGGVSQGG